MLECESVGSTYDDATCPEGEPRFQPRPGLSLLVSVELLDSSVNAGRACTDVAPTLRELPKQLCVHYFTSMEESSDISLGSSRGCLIVEGQTLYMYVRISPLL